MPYIGQRPTKGDENNFKILDDISSYTLTFDGSDSSVVSAANDTITSLNHRFITGQRVTYNKGGGTVITGLSDGVYFIIKEDHNTIKLATSANNAISGTAVNITGVGAGSSHTLNVAFDGVNTKFKATHNNGVKAKVTRSAQLVISINGVIQQPHDSTAPSTGFGFDLDGVIVLSQAPASTDIFWAHVLTNNNVTFDISDNDLDSFTGDGSTTVFNLSKAPPDNRNVLVTIDGVVQRPNDPDGTTRAYSVVENVLTFASAPASGTEIQVRHIGFAGSVTGGSVTNFYGRTGNAVLKSTDNIVVGDATVTGDLTVNGTTTTLDTNLIGVDKIEVTTAGTNVAVAVTQNGTGDLIRLYDGTSQVVTVDDEGKVGVGTDSLTYPLEVWASDPRIQLIDTDLTTNRSVQLRNNQGSAILSTPTHTSFYNSGDESVRITSAGKVGIGTNNPDHDLHVFKDGGDSVITIESTGNGNHSALEFFRTSSAGDSKGAGSIYVTGDTSTSVAKMKFGVAQNISHGTYPRMTIDGQYGRVGIGTENPTDVLDVYSTTDPTIRSRSGSSSVGANIEICGGASNDSQLIFSAGTTAKYQIFRDGSQSDDLRIYDSTNTLDIMRYRHGGYLLFGVNGQERLRINSSGNVGIGTAANYGDAKLTVEGTAALTNNDTTLQIKDNVNDSAAGRGGNIGFSGYVNGTQRTFAGIGGLKSASGTGNFDGDLALYTRVNGQAELDERLRITNIGNVGIGITNPQKQLVVRKGSGDDGGILVKPNVNYANNQNRAYLIVGTDGWDGATTSWNTYGFQHRIKSNGSGVGRATIDTNSGEAFCVENGGNVGIRTGDPRVPLEIKQQAADGGVLRLRDADAQFRYLDFDVTGALTSITARSNNSHGNIDIGTLDQFGRKTVIYVDGGSSPKVGIGTNSPLSLFHVDGDVTIKDASPSILFSDDSGVPQNPDYKIQVNTGNFVINDDTNSATRLLINSSGNVGIGTDDPGSILDVRQENDGGQTKIMLYNTDNDNTTTQTAGLFMSPDSRAFAYAGLSVKKEVADMSSNAGRDVSLVLNVTENNAQVEAVHIASSGKVGIGTNNPNTVGGGNGVHIIESSTGASELHLTNDTTGHTSTDGLAIQMSGGTANIINRHAGAMRFFTGGGSASNERLRITNVGRVYIGNPNGRSPGGLTPQLQVEGIDVGTSSMSLTRNSANSGGPNITFNKTRGTAVGADTIVNNGDTLGILQFVASDGQNSDNVAAWIAAKVDGVVGVNSTPGRLEFYTTALNANTTTERMRIDNNGDVGINQSNPTEKLHVGGNIKLTAQFMQSMPADFWSQGNTFIELNGVGNLTHMGGYETNLTSNGYRDDNGQWVSYNTNSQDGAAQIGLTPTGEIRFRTDASKADGTAHNPTLRAVLDANGFFGIGTADPLTKLHVETTSGTATYATISQQKTYGSGTGTNERAGINLAIREASQVASNRIFGRIEVGTESETTSTNGFLRFLTRQSGGIGERVRITSGGLVGIGTAAPGNGLHVYHPTINTVAKFESGDAGAGFLLQDPTCNTRLEQTGAIFKIDVDADSDTTDETISFQMSNSEKMRIDGTGRVRIGSHSETEYSISNDSNAILQLSHSTGPKVILTRVDTSVSSGDDLGVIDFHSTDQSNALCARMEVQASQSHTDTNKGTDFRFYTTKNNTATQREVFRLNDSGSVTINSSGTSDNAILYVDSEGVETKHNVANQSAYSFKVNSHHTGGDALTGGRARGGIFNDVECGITTGSNTPTAQRIGFYGQRNHSTASKYVYTNYASYNLAQMTKDVDNQPGSNTVTGVYGYAQGYQTGGTNKSANIYGGYFLGYRGGDVNGGHCFGIHARAHNLAYSGTTNASGNTGDMTGVYAECEQDQNTTISNMYAFRGHLDRDNGTVTTGYMFYGSYAGDGSFTNRRGIWIEDATDNYLGGALTITGDLNANSGTKNFRIAHPLVGLSTTKDLVHAAIEGPQVDLIYRGKVDLVNGTATVNLDTKSGMTEGTFVVLTRDVQCFTTNETGWTNVKGSVTGNQLTIIAQENTCTDTISWMVIGERQDDAVKQSGNTDADGKLILEPNRRTDLNSKYKADNDADDQEADEFED